MQAPLRNYVPTFSIDATLLGEPVPSPSIVAYVQRTVAEFSKYLDPSTAAFTFAPYRVNRTAILSMDWEDATGAAFSITFEQCGRGVLHQPPICDACVIDSVDALLLARLIAQAFVGSSRGTL